MLGISDLEKLREGYSAYSGLSLEDALGGLGDPSQEAIVDAAVKAMSHADRNIRVLALRVLAHQRGEAAMRGLLAGLHDEKRRVCAVAIQASAHYLEYEEVAARLEAMARDAGLKGKLRRRALSVLAGDEGRARGDLTPAVSEVLNRLMEESEYRFAIVFGLVRLGSGRRVKALLEEFARSSDDGERRMAERALGGERVIHIGNYEADEDRQRWIMENCELAHGRMYYWARREDVAISRPLTPQPPLPQGERGS